MPATVIAERIGWERSIRVLSGRVAELRPAYLPPDPASRTAYAAGEIAQCDFWFPDISRPAAAGPGRFLSRARAVCISDAFSALRYLESCRDGEIRGVCPVCRGVGSSWRELRVARDVE